eukprot:528300_1
MADIEATETKEEPQPAPKDIPSVIDLENELNGLRMQLHRIEELIREKSIQLATAMAQSVSLRDLDEILNLEHQPSDASTVSLSMDSMDRIQSTDSTTSMSTESIVITPKSKTSKSSKKKKKKKAMDKKRKAKNLWKELENQIQDENIEYVKKLIQIKKAQINDNTQWNGRTMLMMASEHGQYDICCMLINLGADVTMTTKYDDTRDAQYFAHKMGHYHIERLLLISSFGGESSAKIKNVIKTFKTQQAIAADFIEYLDESKSDWMENMVKYVCRLIEKKMAFSDDMLSLCWNYILRLDEENVLESALWKVIISSCSEVIEGKDSNYWYWFRQYMLKSTVWLQPDPTAKEDDKLDSLLIKHLFRMSFAQSKINNGILKQMEEKFEADWKSLIAFDVETNYGMNPRQDEISNGLMAKYSKEELSQNINPSSTFNALKHYDMNQYLPNLLLLCHIINDEFQDCVMTAFGINATTNTTALNDTTNCIKYRRGPIKQLVRCRAKCENDYRRAQFPSSAHVLDVVRCTLIFEDVNGLLEELNGFVDKVRDNKCGVIREIVRVKNGFGEWNSSNPNYCDIKVNVRIETARHDAVIGEMQFLLRDMSIFKLVAHKLYAITRLDEEYLSVLKLKPIMMDHAKCLLNASYFNDSHEISNAMVVHQKDVNFIANHVCLKTICQTNGFKLLKMLTQYMESAALVAKLKECGGFAIICSKGYFDLIRFVYDEVLTSTTHEFDDVLKTGLSEAINAGHFEILEWMFEDRTFLKLWNAFGVTEKHRFFRTLCELGAIECAKLLVQHFGDMFDPNDQSADKYSALTKAIRSKRIETVEWLVTLQYIDLISNNSKKGKIALFEAIDVGCLEIADLLLDQYGKQGHDPKQMLLHKAQLGNTILPFVKNAGYRGRKRKEAIAAVKRWAIQYDVVELQIVNWDANNVKF